MTTNRQSITEIQCLIYYCSSNISFGVPAWQLAEISKHPSYHETLKMTQAEFKLRQEGSDNCYLTCYCESTKAYILSVLERKPNSHTRIEHFEINMTRKNKHTLYEILGTQEKFRDIFVLLEHFEKNPVNHRISRIGTGITKHGDSRKSSKMSKAKRQAALRFHPYKDISTVSCSDPHFLPFPG